MQTSERNIISTWKSYAFDHAAEALLGLIVFYCSQMSTQLRDLNEHLIKSDTRIVEIETSRKERTAAFDRLLDSVDQMKISLARMEASLKPVAPYHLR